MPKFCYWTVADGAYASMALAAVHSARKAGITTDFHIWSDRRIAGAIHHPTLDISKDRYLFKLLYLREEAARINCDYLIWFDADTWFVRDPGDLAHAFRHSPVHASFESRVDAGSNSQQLWWGCPGQTYRELMQSAGVCSENIYTLNAGMWMVQRSLVPKFVELAMRFWDLAHARGFDFTEEAPIAYAMHMLCGHPNRHTVKEMPYLWASDSTGWFKEAIPDGHPWVFRELFSGADYEVNPAIVHAMRSKRALERVGRSLEEGTGGRLSQTQSPIILEVRVENQESSDPLPEPRRHGGPSVVTSAGEGTYEDFLIPFIGSLRDLALWGGQILVLDLGLNHDQIARLEAAGVKVERSSPRHQGPLAALAHFASVATRTAGVVARWDVETCFVGSIHSVFDLCIAEVPSKLICTTGQAVREGAPAGPWNVGEMHSPRANDGPLIHAEETQVRPGFICGDSAVIDRLLRCTERFHTESQQSSSQLVEAVGLNRFRDDHPELVRVVDRRYHCKPEPAMFRFATRFYLKEDGGSPLIEVAAIREATGRGRSPSAEDHHFAVWHPDLYHRWQAKLSILTS